MGDIENISKNPENLLKMLLFHRNPELNGRLETFVRMLEPANIVVITEPDFYEKKLVGEMATDHELIELNRKYYSNSYLYRSNPDDVARTEKDTYISSLDEKNAGATNNWMEPEQLKSRIFNLIKGSMKNKTMYIVPFILGPAGSKYSEAGIQLTDNPYVVINLIKISLVGKEAINRIEKTGKYVVAVHVTGTLDKNNRYIAHFTDEDLIISVNTAYGGNALLTKKAYALRIASVHARDNSRMAEHMMALEVTSPDGRKYGISGAFPSASGKTNLSMIRTPADMDGWDAQLLSDDIIWMHINNDSLYAINPEYGFFGVAPGTNATTNPNAMKAFNRDTIFTNTALTTDGKPWWYSLDTSVNEVYNWHGNLTTDLKNAAHPNSRFTTPIKNYPYLSNKFYDNEGLKIDAMLFGGRRSDLIPLVRQAKSWAQGVLFGAMIRAETTAATTGKVGILRNDPMAMIPFCGYNIGDYFQHWLDMGKLVKHRPEIFYVNWFRKDSDGNFIWPGFSENFRVIEWIASRLDAKANAIETPVGLIPDIANFASGNLGKNKLEQLFEIDYPGWLNELKEIEPFFKKIGDSFPEELWKEFYKMKDG
uniref:phosphoenolpyruvate carboxykinase (GTP) n=1 Tax=Ferroplasma acidiphilum TaxID=74969 RepID=UPI0023F4FDF5